MKTETLIIGKGDNIITMILDNLYSTYKLKDIKQKYLNKCNMHSHTLDKTI